MRGRGRQVRVLGCGAGVVLQPGQPLRSVHPDAAQEADLAHRGADVGGEPGPGGQHQDGRRRRGVRPGGDEHDRPDVAEREDRPAGRVPGRRTRPGRRHRPVPALPRWPGAARPVPGRCRARAAPCPARRWWTARTGASPGGPPARRAPGRRARRPGATTWPPPSGSRTAPAVISTGLTRGQQHDGDGQAEDPAGGGEHRHVHVVEGEDLLAQHGQPVQVLRPLLVRDRGDVGLEPRHVGLQRDRDLVPEAPLHPGGYGRQQPGRHDGDRQRDDREPEQARLVLDQPFAEQREPDREQRVRQRGDQGEDERHAHQRRLVVEAERHSRHIDESAGGSLSAGPAASCQASPGCPGVRPAPRARVLGAFPGRQRGVRRGHRRSPPPRLPRASRSANRCACSENIVQ